MKKQHIAVWYGVILVLIASLALFGCGKSSSDPAPAPLSADKAITAFSFTTPAATGTIDETAKTIAVTAPNGTNVTALIATYTTTGASVKVGSTLQVDNITPNDFTNPVVYTVTAEDGTTATYTVTVTVSTATGSAKAITAFSFTSPAAMGIIDVTAKTIAVMVPHDTNVTALIATFTMTGASVQVGTTAQVTGTTPNNFTGPVVYTVTAADNTTATYTVTVTVAAIAVPKTGQTICYNSAGAVIACTSTGQDGDLLKGIAWPNTRFTNADNSTPISGSVVVDQLTGLMWTKDGKTPGPSACTPAVLKTWQGALDFVACLNTNNYLGYTDWRLPNRKELISLVNYGQGNPETWLIAQGFTNTQTNSYWSSTSSTTQVAQAWHVSMVDVEVLYYNKTYSYYVWPVRAGQGVGIPADQPRTGQTICYNEAGTVIACATTGQDGDLQKGVAWPSPRFVSLGDTTIMDKLTGLAWAPDGNLMHTRDSGFDAGFTNGYATWQHALDYVAKLNTENYLGHNDWRLPNVNELGSLVNAGQSNTAAWLNTLGFTNVQGVSYWSSTTTEIVTTGASNSTNAWKVDMWTGVLDGYHSKNGGTFVWPVRGGQ